MPRRGFLAVLAVAAAGWVAAPSAGADEARQATLRFLGNGAGLCVYAAGEPVLLKAALTRPKGAWRDARASASIVDFWGKTAAQVDLETAANGGTLALTALPEGLSPGWYSLRISVIDADGAWTVSRTLDDRMGHPQIPPFLPPMFAVTPPRRSVAAPGDGPLGVDALISSSAPDLSDSLQVELTARLGVGWARDRISWDRTEPQKEAYDWVGKKGPSNLDLHGTRLRANLDGLRSHGLHVLQVFHGSPAWAQADGDGFARLPDDLQAAYRWAREAATRLAEVEAWEVWNEEDIAHFCADPPDRYAALLKAMALGFRDAPSHPRVQLGPFARDPRVGGYDRVLFANGVRPYLDGYDFHTYAPVPEIYQQVLDTHIAIAQREGFGPGSVWLTETGGSYTEELPPATQAGRESEVRYLLAAYPRALTAGAAPVFWFSLRPSGPGGDKQFGLLNANLEPFPAYQALAVMAGVLGQGTSLGRFTLGKGAAFLFQDGDTEAAVVEPAADPCPLGPLPDAAECLDVMGRTLPIARNAAGEASVSSGGWPFYVRGSAWASRASAPAIKPPTDVPPPSRVVVQVRYPRECVALDQGRKEKNWDGMATNWTPRGYRVPPSGTVTAEVDVYNFSDGPVQGTVEASLPEGFRAEPGSAPFSVPPGGRETIAVALKAARPGSPQMAAFVARDGQGGELSRSVSLWLP